MSQTKFLLNFSLIALLVSFTCFQTAQASSENLNAYALEGTGDLDSASIDRMIKEPYDFAGLAAYYGAVRYGKISQGELNDVAEDVNVSLDMDDWFVAAGRFQVLLFQGKNTQFSIKENKLHISQVNDKTTAYLIPKNKLADVNPDFQQIRYSHLWAPLASLSRFIEACLDFIHENFIQSWGWSIVIFAILLKVALVPVALMTTKFQRDVSATQAILAPKLAEIKANYKGEEAHNRSMALYKELGVSSLFTLKPLLGSFIQVPILVAVFNALGEMPQLNNQSYLWISNLAYPDVLFSLPFYIPFFGDVVSLLPVLMTVITIASTIIFKNSIAPEAEIKRQKRNLYLMGIVFFVFFYPFPAAMVLYWALANILQSIQQQVIKI